MFDFVTSGIPKETLKFKGIEPIHVAAFFDGLEFILGDKVVSEYPAIANLVKSSIESICEDMVVDMLYMNYRTKYTFWAFVLTSIASFLYWRDNRVAVHDHFLVYLKARLKCKNFYVTDHYGYGYGHALGFRAIDNYPAFLRVAGTRPNMRVHIYISQKGLQVSNRGLLAYINMADTTNVTVRFSEWCDGCRVFLPGLKGDIHEIVNGIIDEIIQYGIVDIYGKTRKQVCGSWESFEYHIKIKNAS